MISIKSTAEPRQSDKRRWLILMDGLKAWIETSEHHLSQGMRTFSQASPWTKSCPLISMRMVIGITNILQSNAKPSNLPERFEESITGFILRTPAETADSVSSSETTDANPRRKPPARKHMVSEN